MQRKSYSLLRGVVEEKDFRESTAEDFSYSMLGYKHASTV